MRQTPAAIPAAAAAVAAAAAAATSTTQKCERLQVLIVTNPRPSASNPKP